MADKAFLLVKINHVGDAVAFLPTVASLRAFFPESAINIVCTPATASIFERTVHNVRAITIPFRSARSSSGLLRVLPMLARLPCREYEFALLSHDEPKFSMALASAVARCRIGFDLVNQSWARSLLSTILPYSAGRNIVDLNYDLVRHVTDRPWLAPYRVAIGYGLEDQRSVEEKLAYIGVSLDRPFVVAHPFARSGYREWGLAKYIDFAHRVTAEFLMPCILVAETRDITGLGWPLALGGLSVHELAALFHQATLFVGNNSGPMHVAAAMGTPTLTIQGPSATEWNVFWRDAPHKRMIAHDLSCVPCERIDHVPGYCANVQYPGGCMSEIKVDAVVAIAREILMTCKLLERC